MNTILKPDHTISSVDTQNLRVGDAFLKEDESDTLYLLSQTGTGEYSLIVIRPNDANRMLAPVSLSGGDGPLRGDGIDRLFGHQTHEFTPVNVTYSPSYK